MAYNLTDCISIDFRFTLTNETAVSNVLDCENICLVSNSSYFLLSQNDCSCYPRIYETRWSSTNRDECDLLCEDGLPCGGRERFSLYEVDKKKGTNFTQTPEINTISLGGGDGQDVQKTIKIAGITLGAIFFIVLLGLLVYCLQKKKPQKIPQIEENDKTSIKYLIQDLLPVAPTGLYSVITGFDAKKQDEIGLQVDQVVAIKEAYSDKWARGTNVTTGAQGFFPLACLVSEEKFLERVQQKGLEIPLRKRSAKVSLES
jgi:hypothetical protein